MATSLRQAFHKNLECPICLGFFNDPKILTCSHTFCKGCLETLLESHLDNQSLSCPVCRDVTPIPTGDIGTLPTSKALTSMIADLKTQEKDNEENKNLEAVDCKVTLKRSCKCEVHLNGDEECFCVDCGKYICYRCGVVEHGQEGHKVMEGELHRHAVKTSVEELISRAEGRKDDIDKYISCIEEQRKKCKKVEKQLNDDVDKRFEELVVELIECKEFLKSEGGNQLKEVKTSLRGMEETSRQQITQINAVCELVKNGLSGPLQKTALKAHNTLCEELEQLLSHTEPDGEQLRRMAERSEHIRFERDQGTTGNLLGQVRIGESKWTLVADKQLPTTNSMNGLAASPNNTMSVGCHSGGIVTYSSNGLIQGTVLKNVKVGTLQYRSDVCYIVRNPNNKITLYTQRNKKLALTFGTKSHEGGGSGGLTQDEDGNLYVGYRKSKQIQVFKPEGGNAIREIPCDGYEPYQIFAMSTSNKILVKMSFFTVGVIDSLSGASKHSITKNGVLGFPCLGKDDTVLIAWVNENEGRVNISLYTSELEFTKILIKEFQIPVPIRRWYYLETFKSGEIAFCTPDRLFIFRETSE